MCLIPGCFPFDIYHFKGCGGGYVVAYLNAGRGPPCLLVVLSLPPSHSHTHAHPLQPHLPFAV